MSLDADQKRMTFGELPSHPDFALPEEATHTQLSIALCADCR